MNVTEGYDIGVTIYHQAFTTATPNGALLTLTLTVSAPESCKGATAKVGFTSSILQVSKLDGWNLFPVPGWTRDGSVGIPND